MDGGTVGRALTDGWMKLSEAFKSNRAALEVNRRSCFYPSLCLLSTLIRHMILFLFFFFTFVSFSLNNWILRWEAEESWSDLSETFSCTALLKCFNVCRMGDANVLDGMGSLFQSNCLKMFFITQGTDVTLTPQNCAAEEKRQSDRNAAGIPRDPPSSPVIPCLHFPPSQIHKEF